MPIKVKRLTNKSRAEAQLTIKISSNRLEAKMKIPDLLRRISQSFENGTTSERRLMEIALRLAVFCRVNPSHSLRKEIVAAILLICNSSKAAEIRRYIAGRYLALVAKSSETSDYRMPIREHDKIKAVEIYRELEELTTFELDALDSAEDVLARLARNEIRYPDYFVRDLRVVVFVAQATKRFATTGMLDEAGRKAWAALQYFNLDEDAIPDHLGYVGLTDDMYVLGACAKELLPNIGSIDETVQKVFYNFPFLHSLRFHEPTLYGYSVSDYFVLTCLPIFDLITDSVDQIHHISIVEQPTKHAIFASLVAAFCLLARELERSDVLLTEDQVDSVDDLEEGDIISFDDGRKWIFIGIEREETFGMDMVNLKEPNYEAKEKRGETPLVRKMPLREFKSAAKPNAKGKFRKRRDGSFDLNTAEILFELSRFDYHQYKSKRRIFLVCNKSKYEDLMKDLVVSEAPWKQALPISTINSKTLNAESWSGGFDPESSLLYLVPNLRTLISYYFSSDLINYESLVVVDGSTELESMESLIELQEMGIPVFVFAGSVSRGRTINNLCDCGFSSFKWDSSVVGHLLPQVISLNKDPGISSWEAMIRKDMQSTIESVVVDCEHADQIYSSFRVIDKYGSQNHTELDRHVLDCLSRIKNLTLKLLKLNLNCQSDQLLLSAGLVELSNEHQTVLKDHLLEKKQQDMFSTHLSILENNLEKALDKKADSFSEIADSGIYNSLIAIGSESNEYEDLGTFSKLRKQGSCLIGYWPGQKKLYGLLNRGLGQQIHFVLFRHEETWFQGFLRNYYSTPTLSTVYPNLQFISELASEIESENLESELDETLHLHSLKRSVLSRTYDDEHFAEATAVFFMEPDALVFATDRSQFSVLSGTGDRMKLIPKRGFDIREGDHLIYLPHTGRDAIRDTADTEFLEDGVRDLAIKWRTDLLEFYNRDCKDLENLQLTLRAHNIDRALETIKHWLFDESRIAPINPKGELPQIYKAMGEDISDDLLQLMLQAIESVKRAHVQAADFLSKRLRDQLSRSVSAITEDDDYRIFEVIGIDRCNERVPYRVLSQPQVLDSVDA